MRLKLLVPLASPTRTYKAGEVISLDTKSARSLIDAGSAIPAGAETASVDPGEKAVRGRGRPRKVS